MTDEETGFHAFLGRLSIMLVATVLILSPSIGFAMPFYGNTSVNENQLTTDCFTLGLYSDSLCTIVATDLLTDDDINYSVSNGVYSISTISIGSDSLYLKVDRHTHTEVIVGEESPYLLTATASCYFDDEPADTVSVDIDIGSEGTIRTNNPLSGIRVDSGIYKISMSVSTISDDDLESAPSELTMELCIIATNVASGSCDSGTTVSITTSSEGIIIDTDTANQTIHDANQGNDDFYSDDPPYEFQESVEETNPNGDPIYSIMISAVDNPVQGVADDGDVNVRITIPSNVKFCIRCSSDTGGNNSRLQLNITIDGTTKWVRFNYNNSFRTGYAFNNNNLGNFSPIVYLAPSSSIDRDLNDCNYWFEGDIVEINIFDYQDANNIPDSLMLEIIFWPTE